MWDKVVKAGGQAGSRRSAGKGHGGRHPGTEHPVTTSACIGGRRVVCARDSRTGRTEAQQEQLGLDARPTPFLKMDPLKGPINKDTGS